MKIKEQKKQAYDHFVEINSNDSYSYMVVTFMRRWADLMEAEIESGKTIPEVADKTCDEADTEGITGFMYGCVVSALADFWEYGEDLRVWHNSEYNYNGDGVVNPAVLTIG